MKSLTLLISSFLFSVQLFAGIGGSGGGAVDGALADNQVEHYTTEVCQNSEGGEPINCRMTHFVRQANPANPFRGELICAGEAQNTVCDNPNAHVPEALVKLNKWFTDRGYLAPSAQPDYHKN